VALEDTEIIEDQKIVAMVDKEQTDHEKNKVESI
jgi:hypothetical protein